MEQTADVLEYDGSFAGFLTIVYQVFKSRRLPACILTPETALESLFVPQLVTTDAALATRITQRLKQRVTKKNYQFITRCFHTNLEQKECHLLVAIQLALETKEDLYNYIGHPAILALYQAEKALLREAHSYKGFIRFEYVGDVLYSQIKPKQLVLPFVTPHFARRYPNEWLVIYDETHRLLALIEQGKISYVEDTAPPTLTANQDEKEIQTQWRAFLRAVTIEERENLRSQMSHLPKRYRSHMIDFQEE